MYRHGSAHTPGTAKGTKRMGHCYLSRPLCANLECPEGCLPTPLPSVAGIPKCRICLGRLLPTRSLCLHVPYRLLYCSSSSNVKYRVAGMDICQSHSGTRKPRSPCLTDLPASSTRNPGYTGAHLLRSVTLETWCNTSRKLRHNANTVLKILLMQKRTLLVYERNERPLAIRNISRK